MYRDVGDVGAPDPVGAVDRHPPEKIGINPMRRVGIAGSRRLVDRGQAHQSHQASNPVTADADAVAPQLTDHLAAATLRHQFNRFAPNFIMKLMGYFLLEVF